MSNTILSINQLKANYGKVPALAGVNMCFRDSEIVAILGANGSGKSTVLKSIFGLVQASEGSVVLFDKIVNLTPREAVSAGISYVPQSNNYFPGLTVSANLALGCWKDDDCLKENSQKIFDIFPVLRAKQNQIASELSGGEKQMLAIGIGLMTKPKVLLLDEPTIGLAPKFVKELMGKIQIINQETGALVIIAENNFRVVMSIAHRAYTIDRGLVASEVVINAERR